MGDVSQALPVEEIAIEVGISKIQDLTTSGYIGGLITNAEKSQGVILVSNKISTNRRRFTIGHELGHFLNPWHKPLNEDQFLCSANDIRQTFAKTQDRAARMEYEANKFSSELLMPRRHIQRILRDESEPSIEQILDLAARYKMSKEATARRYVVLHDDPCAVVFSKSNQVRYVARGSAFPFVNLTSGDIIPCDSITWRSNEATKRPTACAEINCAQWNLADDVGDLVEQCFVQAHSYKITLLSVLEEQDETDEGTELEDSWTPRFRRR